MELRQALRLKVGKRLAEADQRRINLHDVAEALDVSERTLRNWRNSAKKGFKPQGRPKTSSEVVKLARQKVFLLMKKHGCPGWRPIAAELHGEVPVRLVQKFVAEFKQEQKIKREVQRHQITQKNVIWTLDGAFTKKNSEKIENQVLKDRGSLAWIGHEASIKASKTIDVVNVVQKSGLLNGFPLVLSTDNGAAYKSSELREFLKANKVIHLRSLPRTPQHNGSVERGICELREIMEAKQSDLKVALECANDRYRRYGKVWSTANLVYCAKSVPYTEYERDQFYKACAEQLKLVQGLPVGFRKRRLMEREVVFRLLEEKGYLKRWKSVKNA